MAVELHSCYKYFIERNDTELDVLWNVETNKRKLADGFSARFKG